VRLNLKKIQILVDVLRKNIQPKTDSVYMNPIEIDNIQEQIIDSCDLIIEIVKKSNLKIESHVWIQGLVTVAKAWSYVDSKVFVPQNPFRE